MDRADAVELAQRFAKIVRAKYACRQFFLFGSYAKGMEHEESDIDLAVVFDGFENIVEMQTELMRLRRAIDSRIEPHPFREKDFNLSNPLAFEILQYGQRIE
ncbi:nucleotidyltransferase domain-containing protein [Candidatus Electronema sp. PJ]|uniref:nucleotidyltransferase domain-containing protein n=1 Tax=Candidatus Electronema sp. PJ TaxID=3401572 RepID=UPI003AA8455C